MLNNRGDVETFEGFVQHQLNQTVNFDDNNIKIFCDRLIRFSNSHAPQQNFLNNNNVHGVDADHYKRMSNRLSVKLEKKKTNQMNNIRNEQDEMTHEELRDWLYQALYPAEMYKLQIDLPVQIELPEFLKGLQSGSEKFKEKLSEHLNEFEFDVNVAQYLLNQCVSNILKEVVDRFSNDQEQLEKFTMQTLQNAQKFKLTLSLAPAQQSNQRDTLYVPSAQPAKKMEEVQEAKKSPVNDRHFQQSMFGLLVMGVLGAIGLGVSAGLIATGVLAPIGVATAIYSISAIAAIASGAGLGYLTVNNVKNKTLEKINQIELIGSEEVKQPKPSFVHKVFKKLVKLGQRVKHKKQNKPNPTNNPKTVSLTGARSTNLLAASDNNNEILKPASSNDKAFKRK